MNVAEHKYNMVIQGEITPTGYLVYLFYTYNPC